MDSKITTTKRPGRPPKMLGGKRVNFYLPEHIRAWLDHEENASRAIVNLVEKQIEEDAMNTVIRFNRDSRRIESVVVCETTVEESEFVWVRPAEEAAQWIDRFEEENREWFGR